MRERLERDVFRATVEQVTALTRAFWADRDPEQPAPRRRRPAAPDGPGVPLVPGPVEQAGRSPATRSGRPTTRLWSGPATGAFNDWVRGSHLEGLAARDVRQIALNLLEGAGVVTRAHQPAGGRRRRPRRRAVGRPAAVRVSRQVPVAVIGLGAVLPGSTDVGGFWRTVVAGRDQVTEVPADRWVLTESYDPDPAAPDRTYGRRGAFVPSVAFEPLRHGVPPRSLPATDAARLLALTVADQVLADAGGLAGVDRTRVGVVLGAAALEPAAADARPYPVAGVAAGAARAGAAGRRRAAGQRPDRRALPALAGVDVPGPADQRRGRAHREPVRPAGPEPHDGRRVREPRSPRCRSRSVTCRSAAATW
nr:beta-ketoacyl synthase N-terminal-like domain-containing protein [Angustibacter aerolatus]